MSKLLRYLTDNESRRRIGRSVLSIILCVLIGLAANVTMLAGLDYRAKVKGGIFTYNGDELTATATVDGNMPSDAELQVQQLDPNSNALINLSEHIDNIQGSKTLLAVEPLFVDASGESVGGAASKTSITFSGEAVSKANETYDGALQAMTASSGNKDIIIKAYQLRQDGEVADLGAVEAAKREYETSYTVETETFGPIVFAATPNIYATAADEGVNFTVEYYAYTDDFDYYAHTKDKGIDAGDIYLKDTQRVLEAFDTSKRSDDKNEKTLPKNGQNNHRIAYYLEDAPDAGNPSFNHISGTGYYKAKTNEVLHQLYLDQSYNIANYSRSGDVNLLANSTSYYPIAIEVYDGTTLRKTYDVADKNQTSAQLAENMAFEEIKAFSNGFRFTTDKAMDGEYVSGDSGPVYIYVTNNTKIKFIFDEIQKDSAKMSSTLYDYDITDGAVYTNTSGTVANKSTWYSNYTRYIYTNRNGINSTKNYDVSGTSQAKGENNAVSGSAQANFGFGTSNVANGLAGEKWNNYTINAYNRENYNNRGCTFGLVTGFDSDLNLVFADGITAPTLFGQSSVSGKEIYNDVDLNFEKSGDCYTLSSVSSDKYPNISASNLQYFARPVNGGNTILTNNFFPLDKMVDNNDSHDVLFGDNTKGGRNIYGNGYSNVPPSDDFSDHNSYFGMSYQIKFTLSDNYTGPLNYLFYGDDDMWVFLDDQLICDIGGIHSSVGEYVDLWEYLGGVPTGTRNTISTKSTTHTLTFFYIERGASGSCCYMRYTLPSVMSVSTEKTDNSILKIEKVVEDRGAKIIEQKNGQKYTLNYGTNGNGNGTITAENKVDDDTAENEVDDEYEYVATGSIVKKDSKLRFTISPDEDSEFTKLTKNGKAVSLKDNSDVVDNGNGTYTYTTTATGDNNETNVVATFTSKNATKYTVKYGVDVANSKGANGTVAAKVDGTTVESEDKVIENKTIVFTVTPNAISEVKEIKVNGDIVSLTDEAVSKGENGVYTYTATVTKDIDLQVVFTKAVPEKVDPSQLLTKNIYLNVRNIKEHNPVYYAWVWGYDYKGEFTEHFQKMELASKYTDEYLNNDDIYVLKLNYVKGQRIPSNFLFTRVNPDKADVIDAIIADPEKDVLEGWGDYDWNNGTIWNKTEDYTNFTDYSGTGSQPNYFETQFRDYTGQTQQLFMDWKYQGNISDKSVYFNEVKRYYFDVNQIKQDGKRFFAYVWSDEHDNSGSKNVKWAENDCKWVELKQSADEKYYYLDLRVGTNFIVTRVNDRDGLNEGNINWDNDVDYKTDDIKTDNKGNCYTFTLKGEKLAYTKGYISKTVYLDLSDVDTGDVDFYAYSDGVWTKLTQLNSDYYSMTARVGKEGCIVRVPKGYNPSLGDINNPNILNKTDIFTIPLQENLFTITWEDEFAPLSKLLVNFGNIDANSDAVQPDMEVLFKLPDSYSNGMEAANGYYRAWVWKDNQDGHWETFENVNEAYKKLTIRKGDHVIIVRSDNAKPDFDNEKWIWNNGDNGLTYDGTTTLYRLSGTDGTYTAADASTLNSDELKPGIYFSKYSVGLYSISNGTSVTVYSDYENGSVVGTKTIPTNPFYVVFREIKKDSKGDVWGRFNFWWQATGTSGNYDPTSYSYKNVWTKIATYNDTTNQTTEVFTFVKSELPSLGRYKVTTATYLRNGPNTPYTLRKQSTVAANSYFYVTDIDACPNSEIDGTGRPIWGYGVTTDGYAGWFNIGGYATYDDDGSATTTYSGDILYSYEDKDEDLPENSVYVANRALTVYDSVNGNEVTGAGTTINREYVFYVKKTKLDSDGNVWGNFDFYYGTSSATANDVRKNVWVQLASVYDGAYAIVAPTAEGLDKPAIGETYTYIGKASDLPVRQGPLNYAYASSPVKYATQNDEGYVVDDVNIVYQEYGGRTTDVVYWVKSTFDGVKGWTRFSPDGNTKYYELKTPAPEKTEWKVADFTAKMPYTANSELTVYNSVNDSTAYSETVKNGYNIYINKVKKDSQGYIWGRFDFYYASASGTSNDVHKDAWVILASPYSETAFVTMVESDLAIPEVGKVYQRMETTEDELAPYYGPSTNYNRSNAEDDRIDENGTLVAEAVNVRYDSAANGLEYWVGYHGTSTVVYFPAYTGSYTGIANALNDITPGYGDFAKRKEIAEANGILGYGGTEEQNNELFAKLKAGTLINPFASTGSGDAITLWYKFSTVSAAGSTKTNYWQDYEIDAPSIDDYPTGVYKLKSDREIYIDYTTGEQFNSNNTVNSKYYIYIREVAEDDSGNIWGKFNYWYKTTGTTATSKNVNKNSWVMLAKYTGTSYVEKITAEESDSADVPNLGYYTVQNANSGISLRQGPNYNGATAVYAATSSTVTTGDEVIVSDFEIQYTSSNIIWVGYVEAEDGNGYLPTSYLDYKGDASGTDLSYYKNHLNSAYRLKTDMPIYTDASTSATQFESNNTVEAKHFILIRDVKKDKSGNIWGKFDFWYLKSGGNGTASDVNRNAWIMLEKYRGADVPGKRNAYFVEEAPDVKGIYKGAGYILRYGPNYNSNSEFGYNGIGFTATSSNEITIKDIEVMYYNTTAPKWSYLVNVVSNDKEGFVFEIGDYLRSGETPNIENYKPGAYKLSSAQTIYTDYESKTNTDIAATYRTLTSGYHIYIREFEQSDDGAIWGQFNYWYVRGMSNAGTANHVYRNVWVQVASSDGKENAVYKSAVPQTGVYTVNSKYPGYSLRSGPNYYGTVTTTDDDGNEVTNTYYNYSVNCYLPSAGAQVGVSDFEVRYQGSLVWMYYTSCSNGEGYAHESYLDYYGKAEAPKLEDYPAGAYKITVGTDIYSDYKNKTQFDNHNTVAAGRYIYVRRTVMDEDGNIWGKFNFWYVTSGESGTTDDVNKNAWIMIAKNNGPDEIGTFYASLQNSSVPSTGEYKNVYTTTDEETGKTTYSSVALRQGPNYASSANPCYARNGYMGASETVVVDDVDVRYSATSVVWSLHAVAKAGEGWQNKDCYKLIKAYSIAQPDVFKAKQDMPVYENYTDEKPTSHTLTEDYNIYIKDFAEDDNGNKWAEFDFWYKTGAGNTGTNKDVLKDAWVLYSDAADDYFDNVDTTIPKTGSYDVIHDIPVYAGPNADSYKFTSKTIYSGTLVDVNDIAVEYSEDTPVWWGCVTVEGVTGWVKLNATDINNKYSDVEKIFKDVGNGAMMGFDVSHHQGANIDFGKARALGYQFVILRAGYQMNASTSFTDTYFFQNYVKAKKAGLKVGVYWFGYSYSSGFNYADISATEAKSLLGILDDLQTYVDENAPGLGKISFEMPIFYDYEKEADYKTCINDKSISKATLTEAAMNFCRIMGEHNYYCGVYTYKNVADNCINLTTISAQYPVWYARYPSALQSASSYTNFNTTAYPKSTWCPNYTGMWQYTDKGDPSLFIPGTSQSNGLDVDVCYLDYETYMRELGLNGLSPIKTEEDSTGSDSEKDPDNEGGEEVIQPDTSTTVNDTTNFPFEIKFYGDDEYKNTVNGLFAYTKYSANGSVSGGGVLNVHGEQGGTFYLRNGEYIIFDSLPDGIYFTVTETENNNYSTSTSGVLNTVDFGETSTEIQLENEVEKLSGLSEKTTFANMVQSDGEVVVKFLNKLQYKYKITYDYEPRQYSEELRQEGRVYYVLTGTFKESELKENLPDLSAKFVEEKTPYVNNFFNSIKWDLSKMGTSYDEETRTAKATVTSHNDPRTADLTVLNVWNFGTANKENGWSTERTFSDTLTLKYCSYAAKRDLDIFSGGYSAAKVVRGDAKKASFGGSEDWLFTTPETIKINVGSPENDGDAQPTLTYKFSHWEIYDCVLDAGTDVVFDENKGLYVRDSVKENFITKVYSPHYNYVAYDDYYVVPIYVTNDTNTNPYTTGADTTISLLAYSRNQFTYTEKQGDNGKEGAVTDKLFADVSLMYFYNNIVFNRNYNTNEEELGMLDTIKVGIALEACGRFETDSDGNPDTNLEHYMSKDAFRTTDEDLENLKEALKKNSGRTSKTVNHTYTRANSDKTRNIINYNINKIELNNKNRLEYRLGYSNTEAVRNMLLKAYSYLVYMEDGEEKIVLSENPVVFLNYYDVGTRTSKFYQLSD